MLHMTCRADDDQIFAPGLWLGYDGVFLPTVQEALGQNDLDKANACLRQVTQTLSKVVDGLDL